MLHISRCVSSRKTYEDQPHCSISIPSKVLGKNAFDLIWHRITRRRGYGVKHIYTGHREWPDTRQSWDNYKALSPSSFQKKMVWSENWPDLRSLKSKFLRFVGTDAHINIWKFHVNPLRTIVTAQSQIFLKVGSLDLTWWPDLRWTWAEIFRKGAERMYKKVCKKRQRFAPLFFTIREKRGGGV